MVNPATHPIKHSIPQVIQTLGPTWRLMDVVILVLHTGHFIMTGTGPNLCRATDPGCTTMAVVVELDATKYFHCFPNE